MRNRGYSLIELMAVLVLTGITVSIATPSASNMFRRTATRTAVDQFVTTHSLARSTAVRYGREAEFHIDAANARFWVEVDTSTTGAGAMATVGRVKRLEESKVTITSDRSILCFDSRGLATTRGSCEAADATIVFSQEAHMDTVKISAIGKVFR